MQPVLQSAPLMLKLAALVAIAVVLIFGARSLVNAQQEFPTPPPASRGPTPIVEPVTTPAEMRLVAGAALWEIQPIPQGPIPAVPPVLKETIQAPGHLSLAIEAGTLGRTMQLVFDPLDIEALPRPKPSQKLIKGFDLTFFDTQGQRTTPAIRRPLVLEVLTSDLPPFGGDPTRLIFARFENGQWLPLVTTYFQTEKRLVVRVLELGRFAVLVEQPPF